MSTPHPFLKHCAGWRDPSSKPVRGPRQPGWCPCHAPPITTLTTHAHGLTFHLPLCASHLALHKTAQN